MNALYRVVPQVRLRVSHDRTQSRADGQAHRIDGLEFKIEPRGLFGFTDCFKLHFYETGVERARLDLFSFNGSVQAEFASGAVEIRVYRYGLGVTDTIRLKYGSAGRVDSVEIQSINPTGLVRSHFCVQSDDEVAYREVFPSRRPALARPR